MDRALGMAGETKKRELRMIVGKRDEESRVEERKE